MKARLLKLNQMYKDDKEVSLEVEKKRIVKDKRNEIFQDYDTSMEEFKSSLLKVIGDLIGEINDIDILIIHVLLLLILLF